MQPPKSRICPFYLQVVCSSINCTQKLVLTLSRVGTKRLQKHVNPGGLDQALALSRLVPRPSDSRSCASSMAAR